MGENSKIIVVANQKGGVGKTTVCMAMANYFSLEMKFRVGGIIDTDFQKSVVERREADKERCKGTSQTPAYDVTPFNIDNYEKIPDLIEELRKHDLIYIFDTPGRLNHQGIVALTALADFVVVPFNFDKLSLFSTNKFVDFWKTLKSRMEESMPGEFHAKLFFLPMTIDNRIGTKAEKVAWNFLSRGFMKTGYMLPAIPYAAEMKRCDSIILNPRQVELVAPSFETMMGCIMQNDFTNRIEESNETDENPES